MKNSCHTIHEYDAVPRLLERDHAFLQKEKELVPTVLSYRQGKLSATSYVGIVTLPSGEVLEILPKVPLVQHEIDQSQETRQVFIRMLRDYRWIPKESTTSKIRALKHFTMLEYFIEQFLRTLLHIVQEGLARQYITMEDNLPYCKGRIVFNEHLRRNLVNKALVYSTFSELSPNRPVNRLIVSTLNALEARVGYGSNRKTLLELQNMFVNVPASRSVVADWKVHNVDRSMRHYSEVMKWIGLFLFNQGLTTYTGEHSNMGLLFPMEEVFEDFVTANIRRHLRRFQVHSQGPQQYLAKTIKNGIFMMKPDITLRVGEKIRFVLDVKWKKIYETNRSGNFGISQSDLYQLYAYGKRYKAEGVFLIYPKRTSFKETIRLQYFDDLPLICFPFDVNNPAESVEHLADLLDTAD